MWSAADDAQAEGLGFDEPIGIPQVRLKLFCTSSPLGECVAAGDDHRCAKCDDCLGLDFGLPRALA
jgi:hypothetical protein